MKHENISNKFDVSNKSVIYEYKGVKSLFIPKGSYVAYYSYNPVSDLYTGVLNKEGRVLHIVALLLVIICIALSFKFGLPHRELIRVPDSMQLESGHLTLNIDNVISNANNVSITLKVNDRVIYDTKLKPGEAVGTIAIKNADLNAGVYNAILDYSINTGVLDTKKEYDIKLIVK